MKIITRTPDGEPFDVHLTALEYQVIQDLQGFHPSVSTDQAIKELKILYPELVPSYLPKKFADNGDDEYWAYVRTQR